MVCPVSDQGKRTVWEGWWRRSGSLAWYRRGFLRVQGDEWKVKAQIVPRPSLDKTKVNDEATHLCHLLHHLSHLRHIRLHHHHLCHHFVLALHGQEAKARRSARLHHAGLESTCGAGQSHRSSRCALRTHPYHPYHPSCHCPFPFPFPRSCPVHSDPLPVSACLFLRVLAARCLSDPGDSVPLLP